MDIISGFKNKKDNVFEFGTSNKGLDRAVDEGNFHMVATCLNDREGSTFTPSALSGIKYDGLYGAGFDVHASQNDRGEVVKLEIGGVYNNVRAKEMFDIIASCNEDIVVTYRDTLDNESKKLARKSKKPLWFVTTGNNGVVTLERQF